MDEYENKPCDMHMLQTDPSIKFISITILLHVLASVSRASSKRKKIV